MFDNNGNTWSVGNNKVHLGLSVKNITIANCASRGLLITDDRFIIAMQYYQIFCSCFTKNRKFKNYAFGVWVSKTILHYKPSDLHSQIRRMTRVDGFRDLLYSTKSILTLEMCMIRKRCCGL